VGGEHWELCDDVEDADLMLPSVEHPASD